MFYMILLHGSVCGLLQARNVSVVRFDVRLEIFSLPPHFRNELICILVSCRLPGYRPFTILPAALLRRASLYQLQMICFFVGSPPTNMTPGNPDTLRVVSYALWELVAGA